MCKDDSIKYYLFHQPVQLCNVGQYNMLLSLQYDLEEFPSFETVLDGVYPGAIFEMISCISGGSSP